MARGKDPISRIVQNLFTIQRLGNSVQAEGQVLLDALFDAIAADIESIDPAGASIQRWRRFRTNKLIESVEERLSAVFPEWERVVQRDLARAGVSQGVFAEDTLIFSLGRTAAKGVVRKTPITLARANTILNTHPFGGVTGKEVLADWAGGLEAITRERIIEQIRFGMLAEESNSAIVKRVRGARSGSLIDATGKKVPRYLGGVWKSTTRDATAVVRTAVTSISATAQLETYQKNAHVLLGIQYSAALDDRTCFVAGTMVLTPEGYRPIEEIQGGDWVIGGSGKPCRVKHARTQIKEEMARVTLSNGQVIECTADHFWLTAGQEWLEAQELKLGEVLASQQETWSGEVTPEEVLRNGWLENKPEHRRADSGPGEVYVEGVESFRKPTTVYDIHVEVDRCFIVADVVVHNTDICLGLDGTVWPVDSPDIVVPGVGTHWQCVPGDTKVLSRFGIAGASKRWFDGEVVVIRTASGRELTCTPNHPVLTDAEWMAAGLLDVGGHVISDGGSEWESTVEVDGNGEDVPVAIHEVAESFFSSGNVVPEEVPTTAPDFHGDGEDGQVAVVGTDGQLRDRLQATFLEHVRKGGLPLGDRDAVLLPCPGSTATVFEGLLSTSRRVMRSLSESLSLLWRRSVHPRLLLLRSIADMNTMVTQDAKDGLSINIQISSYPSRPTSRAIHLEDQLGRDIHAAIVDGLNSVLQEGPLDDLVSHPEGLSNRSHGLSALVSGDNGTGIKGDLVAPDLDAPGLQAIGNGLITDAELASQIRSGAAGPVFLDQIVSVEVKHFRGHVYNLETGSGFYSANGIITHNCRSSLVPVPDYQKFGLTPPEDGFRKARDLSGLTDEDLSKKLSTRRGQSLLGKQKNIRSSTTAEGWLRGESQRVQNKMLGKGKAQLFRDGKITLKDLVRDDLSTIPLSELLADLGIEG